MLPTTPDSAGTPSWAQDSSVCVHPKHVFHTKQATVKTGEGMTEEGLKKNVPSPSVRKPWPLGKHNRQ